MVKVEAGGAPRTDRDRDRCCRGRDRARRRHGHRGGRSRQAARDHPRVPRPGVRVPLPAQGAADVPRPRTTIADQVAVAISDAARSGHESGDGLVWKSDVRGTSSRRAWTGKKAGRGRGRCLAWSSPSPTTTCSSLRARSGSSITAVLVMFMQAGFAFLEAGGHADEERRSHRQKERPDLRGLLARLLGGRLRDRVLRRRLDRRHHGFFPSVAELIFGRQGALRLLHGDPRRSRLPVRGGVRGRLLAIVWGAMAERARL